MKLLLDVRRQGHSSESVQNLEKDSLIEKANFPIAVGEYFLHNGAELALAEYKLRPFANPFARTAEAFPAAVTEIA